MTVKEALEKEVETLRKKHMLLVQTARDKKDLMYGMATLNLYEHLISSYSRVLKDLDNDR